MMPSPEAGRLRARQQKAHLKMQEAVKAAAIKRARNAAEFLTSEIGGAGVREFLDLLGDSLTEFQLIFEPSRRDGFRRPLTAWEIEERFGPNIALPDEPDAPRALS